MAKKKAPMKSWVVQFTIAGRASLIVEARTEEEAREKAMSHEGEADMCEWEYDELRSIQENT